MKSFLISMTALILFCQLCIAGTINPKVDDKEYIEYGAKHECVVPIFGKATINGEDKKYNASAVIIKPRVILTAAHVITNAKHIYILNKKKEIPLSLAIMPPQYNEDQMGPFDLAIGYLESEAVLDFYPQLYDKDDEVGKICSLSGFGVTGSYMTGANKSDGKQRAGSNIIDGIANGMLFCSVNRGKNTSLEFLISHGDSGGGLFIDKKLAGIHSCIMTENGKLDSNFNDESLHTRISIHKDWIELMIDKLETAAKKVESR